MHKRKSKKVRTGIIVATLVGAATTLVGVVPHMASAATIPYTSLRGDGAKSPSSGNRTAPYHRACTAQTRCARG